MTEVSILLARVEALERTVAELQTRHSPITPGQHFELRGVLRAMALAVSITGAVVWVHAEGNPNQLVVGPGGVIVTNAEGRPAVTMSSPPGTGGRIALFNAKGSPVAQFVSSWNQCCGRLEIFQDGDIDKPKVVVGVSDTFGAIRFRSDSDAYSQISAFGFGIRGTSSDDPSVLLRDDGTGGLLRLRTAAGATALMLNNEDGNGLLRAYGPSGVTTVLGSSNGTGMLRLNSNGQAAMLAQGDGRLSFTNAGGANLMTLGANTTGGYLVANNNNGQEAATLSVEGDGSGRVQLWRSGQLSLIAGTTQGKGDLCVNGIEGSLCMGLLGVKTMTKY